MNKVEPKYSVIVSVYNSEKTIFELVNRIDATMKMYNEYELLFIDDLSTDNSWNELIKAKNGREHIRLIRLTKNFGQAKVLLCGINQAKANILISIDDDLQYPPEEINKLIESYNPNNQYILFGVPEKRKTSFFNNLTSTLTEKLINKFVLSTDKGLKFSSFRIFTKKTHNREQYNESTLRNVQVFFTMVSPDLMDYIYVKHEIRDKGKSSYNFFKRFMIGLDLLLTSSSLPTKFVHISLLIGILYTTFELLKLFIDKSIIILISNLLQALTYLSLLCIIGMLFYYLKKLYLEKQGANTYAIWEEK